VRDIENMLPDFTEVMGQPSPAAGAAEGQATPDPPSSGSAPPATQPSTPITPGEAATMAHQEPAPAPVVEAPPPPVETPQQPDSLSRLLSDNAMTIVTNAANVASGLFADMFLIFLYVAFLYVSVGTLSRKLDRIFVRPADRERARMVGADVRRTMEQYLWLQTAMSIINTSLTYVTLLVLGLDNALFWAFVIFVLNYIPTIGSFVAMFLPALFALVQPSWPGWMPQEPMWAATAVFAGVAFWQFLIGNFLAPRVMSNSLNLSPVVVLLSLAVWGTVWGPLGMFLSAPLTVLVMIVLAQIPGARWIAILLSADGNPGEYSVKLDEPAEDLRHAQLTDI
jgi:predicted PurR-regulated permease PerM